MMTGFHVRVDTHLTQTSEKVFGLMLRNEFCDCTLTSGHTVVNAHRAILCTVDYFYSMFSRGWRETISTTSHLNEKDDTSSS